MSAGKAKAFALSTPWSFRASPGPNRRICVAYENVLLHVEDSVATLTLNRPTKMNALSDGLLLDMQAALDEIEKDKSVRAAIITGAGKAFCAGFDLSPRAHPFTTVQDWRDHVKLGNDTWFKIWRSRLPFIAAVNG